MIVLSIHAALTARSVRLMWQTPAVVCTPWVKGNTVSSEDHVSSASSDTGDVLDGTGGLPPTAPPVIGADY